MIEFESACNRGRAWPSRSRTQGEAFGGAKGEPEDAEMRRARRAIRACVDSDSVILGLYGSSSGARLTSGARLRTRASTASEESMASRRA